MGETGGAATPAQANNYATAAGVSQGVGGAMALENGIIQAHAYSRQGSYQRSLSNINARMAQMQAVDAVQRGRQTAGMLGNRGAQIEAKQRVAQAASGTDVNSGTNASIQANTQALSRIDQLTAANNAALEAIGFKMQASNLTSQGRMAYIAGRGNAGQSIISGGMGFAKGITTGMATYDKYRVRAPGTPVAPADVSSVEGVAGTYE